jgi:hypothetical protein
MNNTVILTDVPFEIDSDQLIQKLHIPNQEGHIEKFKELVNCARSVARPKAMYKISYIESRGANTVTIDGIRLTSRILRVNLDEIHRVFPFVATCGRELAEWSKSFDDILEQFWVDAIMKETVHTAFDVCKEHIETHLQTGQTSFMEPGSLEDWPTGEQKALFKVLGNPLEAIGVELTDSCLMVPIKSLSGNRFPTEVNFENCQLCPRENCSGRRAAYDPILLKSKYK